MNEKNNRSMPAEDLLYRQRIYDTYRSGHAKTVDDRAGRGPHLRAFVRRAFPANRDSAILDLGCGSGSLLYFLQEAGYRNTEGVDVSRQQVEAARQLGITGVRQGDLFSALKDSPSDSYDVIIAFDVIEHLTKTELLYFAEEVYRILKRGGRWIIHAPNAESPFGGAVRYGDWTHEQAFTRRSIYQIMHAIGFKQVQCFEDRPVPHGAFSTIRWLGWNVIRTIYRISMAVETGNTKDKAIFSRNLLAIAFKG